MKKLQFPQIFRWIGIDIKVSPLFEIFLISFCYQTLLIGFSIVLYDSLFLGLGLVIVECFKIFQEEIQSLNLKENANKIGDLVNKQNELNKFAGMYFECFHLAVFMRFITVAGTIWIFGYTILEVKTLFSVWIFVKTRYFQTNGYEKKVGNIAYLIYVTLILFTNSFVGQRIMDEVLNG